MHGSEFARLNFPVVGDDELDRIAEMLDAEQANSIP